LLMQQPYVAETKTAPVPDRHAIKRMARAGTNIRDVRVITLRKAAVQPVGGGDREYHHRWIVRSHWRKQWYPSQQRHVPKIIPAYVKGPDGAPMLTGRKVYAWRR
jgi:hypothetical protein